MSDNAESVRTADFADECRRRIKRHREHAAELRLRADQADTLREIWEGRLERLIDGTLT